MRNQTMTSDSNDLARQWLNIITAPAMWILSTLPQIMDWGRSAKEFSDANNSLLVPYGIAFSIWFPIFIGCIGYAILQGLKANRGREIFRKTGWWTGVGFAGVCGWALLSGWGSPMMARWGTALIFIPTVLCLVKAMLRLTRGRHALDTAERFWVWGPISLIAGWTSIAMFLNWTPIVADNMPAAMSVITSNIVMLALALIWAIFVTRRSGGNIVYVFPIAWGLAWLAFKSFTQTPIIGVIGITTIIGIAMLLIATFLSRKNR
ncbi:MAG: hypothetical protein ABJN69_11045 [Hellea sp.]